MKHPCNFGKQTPLKIFRVFHPAIYINYLRMKRYGLFSLIMGISFMLGFAFNSQMGETKEDNMPSAKRVTGLGGIFFKSENPAKLKEWYQTHLGLQMDQYGTNFEWRQGDNPDLYGFTQWSAFINSTNYFEPSEKDFMINYRVDDLAWLVKEMQKEGVIILDSIETYEYGKFIHILDIEGNKIELWEPVDSEYDKIVVGRTK